ncbi:MAG: prepilin-type N-terminal cleavage/methylation domain-containing protein [Deltaproteobacteria bacterium]|nr:prepilin-type N-terminal cleavage/methylation domain-containing protein [Deltaproteobacteria bacterium]
MMKEQNGFTLLEVIIALFIFSIGLLAVASMQMTSIKGNYFSGTLTEATNWAADQMETLMSLPYADGNLVDVPEDYTVDPDDLPDECIYTIKWNVADDATTNNTKTIKITVYWKDRGSQRTLELYGIKAR